MYTYHFELLFLVSPDKYQEYELLHHMIVLFLIFGRNLHILFHNVCTNVQFHESGICSLSSYFFQHIISCPFDKSHCGKCEVIFFGFNFHFFNNHVDSFSCVKW